MKEKSKLNIEDLIELISKSPPEEVLLEALQKFSRSPPALNFRSSTRIFKVLIPLCSLKSKSEKLCKAALLCGLNLISSDLTAVSSMALFSFFDLCRQLLLFLSKKHSQAIDIAEICFEVLKKANTTFLIKVFHSKAGGSEFFDIVCFGLKVKELKNSALEFCDNGLSVPVSENLGEAISERKADLMEILYPFLFNESQSTRRAALAAMQKIDFKTKPVSWKTMIQRTMDVYSQKLSSMVTGIEQDWPEIWNFVISLLGKDLHTNSQLVNKMLGVIELGYKHRDLTWTRVQAFSCWKTLIDNFKSGLSVKKRMDLILIPLRAANHRSEALACAKLDTYAHLLKTMTELSLKNKEVVKWFVIFCFGSESGDPYPPVKSYPALHGNCCNAFELLLVYSKDPELFSQVYDLVIQGTGECIYLKSSDISFVEKLWSSLLAIIDSCSKLPSYKGQVVKLLDVIKWLITRSSECSGLASLIIYPLLHCMVIGEVSLKSTIFINATIYSGSSDVMEGTPALQVMEWLVEFCAIPQENKSKYLNLVSEIIKVGGSVGSLNFFQSILKKMQRRAEKGMIFMAEESSYSAIVSLTKVWTCLAKQLLSFMEDGGEINQGDAAQHDFHCVYSMLLYPAEYLHPYLESPVECEREWCQIYEKASTQVALVATAENYEFCDQICQMLAAIASQSSFPRQVAAVHHFLTCVLLVESNNGHKSSKRWNHIQTLVAGTLLQLLKFNLDKEQVFMEACVCAKSCLILPISFKMFAKMCHILCVLLKEKRIIYDHVSKVFEALEALKAALSYVKQHSKECLLSLKSAIEPVISAGQNHASQKIRSLTLEVVKVLENCQGINTDGNSQDLPLPGTPKRAIRTSGSKLRKLSNSPVKPSGVVPSKGSSKKLLPAASEFVEIETPPKKIILTEHQKEVMKDRRRNIPALYQDLTQETQSMSSSQEVVVLTVTPPKYSRSSTFVVEEDAVMDVSDVVTPEKHTLVSSTEKILVGRASEKVCLSPKSFTPPSGFLLHSNCESNSKKSVTHDFNSSESMEVDESISHSYEPCNAERVTNVTMKQELGPSTKARNRRKASTPVHSTQSLSTKTRSGRVIKRLSLQEDKKKQKKLARKSLPNVAEKKERNTSSQSCLNKSQTESVSDTTVNSNVSLSGKKEVTPMANATKASLQTLSGKSLQRSSSSSSLDAVCLKRKHSSSILNGKALKRSFSNSNLDQVKPGSDFITKLKSSFLNCEVSESQDVIESSQEPSCKVIGQCAVALETFRDPGPNGKLEISDVILLKGPKAGSPFKVLTASDPEDKVNVAARRFLDMDLPLQCPSTSSPLKMDQTHSTVGNGSTCSSNDEGKHKSPVNSNDLVNSPQNSKSLSALKNDSSASTPVKSSSEKSGQPSDLSTLEEKQINPTTSTFEVSSSRNDLLPEWMHEKKSSPSGNGLRISLRSASSMRGQAFLKPVSETDVSTSPLVSSNDSQSASPVPQKKFLKTSSDSNCNVSPIMKRSGRAAQLLGLGQAAAVRGGEQVLAGASLSNQRPDDREALTGVQCSAVNGIPLVSINQDSSPSVRKKGKLLLKLGSDAPKATPSKALTDEGIHEDWVPKVPLEATPSSILKRTHNTDFDAQSPNIKRKRVSFRDPPLTQLLSFNDTNHGHGTLISAPQHDGRNEISNETALHENEVAITSRILDTEKEQSPYRQESISVENITQKLLSSEPRSELKVTSESLQASQTGSPLAEANIVCRIEKKDSASKEPNLPSARASAKLADEVPREQQNCDVSKNNKKENSLVFNSPVKVVQHTTSKVTSSQADDSVRDKFGCNTPTALEGVRRSERNTENSISVNLKVLKWQKSNGIESPVKTPSPNKEKVERLGSLVKASSPIKGKEKAQNYHSPPKSPINVNYVGKISGRTTQSPRKMLPIELCPPTMSSTVVSTQTSEAKMLKSNSYEKENETQGMLEDIQCVSSSDPVFPSLLHCEHPIDFVVSDLTTPSWKKALLKDLLCKDVRTIGSLAALSEEQINRFNFKGPKVEIIKNTLQKFEDQHDLKPYFIKSCGSSLSPSSKNTKALEALMSEFSSKDLIRSVSKRVNKFDLLENFSSESMVEVLKKRLGATGAVKELMKQEEHEKEVLEFVILKSNPGAVLDMLEPKNRSGEKELDLSPEQVSAFLKKINPATLRELVCPTAKNRDSFIAVDVLWDYVLKKKNLQAIPPHCIDTLKNNFLPMTDINTLVTYILEGIQHEKLSSDSINLLSQNVISRLDQKELFRLLCQEGLKRL